MDVPSLFYDPKKSSTASVIPCNGESYCTYTLPYADGTNSSGYLVQDVIYLEQPDGSTVPTPTVFGCGTQQTGDLALGVSGNGHIDGILGLGPNSQSPLSQWSSAGVAPRVFAHCRKGKGNEGGSLEVFEELDLPGVVYTPLLPSDKYYLANLQGIGVNGTMLQINSSVFAHHAVFDSGSTLTYLHPEAYRILNSMINAFVSKSVGTTTWDEYPLQQHGKHHFSIHRYDFFRCTHGAETS